MKSLLLVLLFGSVCHSSSNSETIFRKLVNLVLPKQYKFDWKEMNFSADLKNLKVKGTDLCFSDQKSKTRFCSQNVELMLPYLNGFLPQQGSRIHFKGISGQLVISESTETKSDAAPNIDVYSYLQYLTHLRFLDLKISIENFRIKMGTKKPLRLSATVTNQMKRSRNHVTAIAELHESPWTESVSKANIGLEITDEQFSLNSNFKISLLEGRSTDIEINIPRNRFEQPIANAQVSLKLSTNKNLLQIKSNHYIESRKIITKTTISIDENKYSLDKCKIKIATRSFEVEDLRCRIAMKEVDSGSLLCHQHGGKRYNCKIDLQVDRAGQLKLDASIPRRFNFSGIKLNGRFFIGDFNEFVLFLKENDINIPAPLASLRGEVSADLSTDEITREGLSLSAIFHSDLDSKNQKVLFKSENQIRWSENRLHIKSTTELSNIEIILPKLKLGSMPQVTLDSRMQPRSNVVDEEKSTRISYEFEVKTQQPILIKTQLIKNAVPIALRVKGNSQSKKIDGTIEIQPMEIEFFKRQAKVKFLRIHLKPDIGKSKLNGLIEVQQGKYLINTHLHGTIDEPFVRMESTPFLPESDIVSVLIFGRTQAELGGEQANSSNEIQAAMASRAFTLISLFYLSSTPIESIVYDPVDNKVTAHLKIAGNRVSLSSESGGLSAVGLEKRIFQNFVLRTSKSVGDTDSSVTTSIEWEKRY